VSARAHIPDHGKSAKRPAKRLKCPICGKSRSEQYRPFCSKHCADIDLGRWLGGRYAVPGEPVAKDEGDNGDDEDRQV
jgi:endogenous inhibitor of DNA gyrase (YacG/DUF329 family)